MRVKVLLTNRRASFQASQEVLQCLSDFWSFSPAGLWYMPQYKATKILRGQREQSLKQLEKMKKIMPPPAKRIAALTELIREADLKLAGMWDGKIRLMKKGAISAGLFRATAKEAEAACGVEFDVEERLPSVGMIAGLPPAAEQFRHQNECADAMIGAMTAGGGIVLAATSSGKTAIAARLFASVDTYCLFVVDQVDLLYQQRDELAQWLGEEVGVVGDQEFNPKRVTVGTIQTLSKRADRVEFKRWYDIIRLMVVDELHEQLAKRDFYVLQRVEPLAVYGLTATLQLRKKEVRLKAFAFAGPVIYEFPISVGVERGVLTKGYALQLLFPVRMDEGAKYQEELRGEVLENDLKLECCRALVIELIEKAGRHVTVLTERVQHLKDVEGMFADLRRGVAYGSVPVAERRKAVSSFEREAIDLLVANKVFKKGISIKRIDAMIDMAEGKSSNDVVQKFGRGLRLHPDKREFLFIDFGTVKGRFGRNARARRTTMRKAGIRVVVAEPVTSADKAVKALRKFIRMVTQ